MKQDYFSITRLQDYIGKKVEIIAFDISYMGVLTQVDYDNGTLRIEDGDDFAILEIERVESFSLAEKENGYPTIEDQPALH